MNLDPLSGMGPSLSDIFSRRRGGGAPVRRPVKEETAPEEDEAPESAAEETEEEKEKAVLKNPKWDVEKVGFNEETDISVEAELPEAEAHKTKIAFELFAKTPDGEERISQADGNVTEGKAVAKIPVFIPTWKDEEGNLLQEVEYYFSAKHSASDLLKDAGVVKLVKEMANLLLQSHILEDVTFASSKSQVRPAQAAKLKALTERIAEWKQEHPEGKLAIFGHADAEGKEEPNKKLSERRAKAIHAFLMKDAAAWDALAKEEKWDKKAIPDFQAFMDENNALSLTDKDFDSIDGKAFAGCSEFNQVEAKEGAHEPNRRVSVFLLQSNKNFPIQYPCKHGDIAPCKSQVARKGDRRTPGFGCLFYDKLITESKGEPGAKGTVKLVGITDATIKQYVNMDPEEGKPELGIDRKIEVEVEGLGDGDEVFWTVRVGEKNSARTEPKTGPKLLPEDAPVEFADGVAALVSTVEGGKSHILLACGVCGGDEFTVEAGGARDKVDCKFKIVTWRRVGYETLHPKAKGGDRLTDYGVFTPDKSPGLAEGTRKRLVEALAKTFVEIEEIHKDCFLAEDLPDDGKWNILDGKVVQMDAGKKVLVASRGQLDNARVFHGKVSANNRAVSIIWSDYMAEGESWNQKFGPYFWEQPAKPKLNIFENAVDGGFGISQGGYFIKSLKWAVTHWWDPSAAGDSKWKPVSAAGDPGYAWKDGGTLTDPAEIKAHIKYDNFRNFRFAFPEDKAHWPGKCLKRNADHKFEDKGKLLGVSLTISGVGYNTYFLGWAYKGKIWMNTKTYNTDPVGMATLILHELGHNLGQGYGDKAIDPNRGRAPEHAIPGIPFPKGVPEGDKYGEKGHKGIHCAIGVVDKAAPNYAAHDSTAFAEHQCIMFGATDVKDSKKFDFCDECTTFIRAEQLTDIKKDWAD